ncbi:metalloendopeptidase, partial [Coemansia sp. RSA 2618]
MEISRANKVIASVLSHEVPTFKNTIEPLARHCNAFAMATRVLSFLQNVSTDANVRNASSKADTILDFAVARDMRKDVHKLVCAVYDNPTEMAQLDDEDRMLVTHLAQRFRTPGMHLADEQQQYEQAKRIDRQLVELEIAFTRNISQDTSFVLLSREELDGLPPDYFANRRTELCNGADRFVVTTRASDVAPVLKHATREATRKAVYVAQSTRCPNNIELLQASVRLRLEKARLFGYATYADYILAHTMAKTPGAVAELEEGLRARLLPLAAKEMDELCAMKRAEAQAAGLAYTGFYEWDHSRFASQAMAQLHCVDMDEISAYFELDATLDRILALYTQTLGLTFAEAECPDAWHPSVRLYEVREAAGEGAFVGHVYADLHERADKYRDIAVWPLRSSAVQEDGTRMTPASAVLASFPNAAPVGASFAKAPPVLLAHSDVKNLVHALGHVFHNLCSTAKWSEPKPARDFAEVSAQLFTQWVWEPAALRTLGAHHRTGAPIPGDLITRLVRARTKGSAVRELRQVFRGLYDLDIHSTADGNIDVGARYNELSVQVALANYGGADV